MGAAGAGDDELDQSCAGGRAGDELCSCGRAVKVNAAVGAVSGVVDCAGGGGRFSLRAALDGAGGGVGVF